jgi:hypothetical protein
MENPTFRWHTGLERRLNLGREYLDAGYRFKKDLTGKIIRSFHTEEAMSTPRRLGQEGLLLGAQRRHSQKYSKIVYSISLGGNLPFHPSSHS